MTITVEIDFCKENISDFSDLAKMAYQYALAFGRELVQRIVEERDAELREARDRSRYVNKGKRKTCLKTMLGDVEFERTVYVDKAVPEGHHCVFLLDEDLSIDTVGLQGFGNADINVLDVFHRNKALLTHVQNADFRKLLMKHLYDKNIPMLLDCIEAMINSEENAKVQEHYRTLRSYYENNADGLLSAYDRGVTIPETSEPGAIHHARLGSMESNVFTLIGNRMKGRRACWSIRGATNLANLLCLYHTTGFSGMFTGFPASAPEAPAIDDWKSLSASQMPLKTGKGFECWKRTTVPNLPWLKALTGYQSLSEIRLS